MPLPDTITTPLPVGPIVARWTDPARRPLFKGSLIKLPPGPPGYGDVCYCAQGDILHDAGMTDAELQQIGQERADRAIAKLLGISLAHSVLLREINDSKPGCPQDVLAAPEKILGPHARRILCFWQRLDRWDETAWRAFF